MSTYLCLRCKTTALSEVPQGAPDSDTISFYECPVCGRQYSLKPGKTLVFRWLHPITLALYGTLFDTNPVDRAETDARTFIDSWSPEQLQILVDEIRLELNDPTQQVREMLGCRASEEQLRQFLHVLANHVEKWLTEETILNKHVRLKSFNGIVNKPAEHVREHEDYWKLVGLTGQIIADEKVYSQTFNTTEPLRVLVKFHDHIKDMGLASHNEKNNSNWGNSLWILKDDLEFIDEPK